MNVVGHKVRHEVLSHSSVAEDSGLLECDTVLLVSSS
jgi:hypothetical protein